MTLTQAFASQSEKLSFRSLSHEKPTHIGQENKAIFHIDTEHSGGDRMKPTQIRVSEHAPNDKLLRQSCNKPLSITFIFG